MTQDGADRALLIDITTAVRRAVFSLGEQRPGESLAGLALCSDDSLGTLFALMVTHEAIAESEEPDLLFTPTDWPYELEPDALAQASAELEARASAAPDLLEHVDRSFDVLVEALAAVKRDGVVGAEVFLSVLSTDPSPYLEELEDSSVGRLNSDDVIRARRQFLDAWS